MNNNPIFYVIHGQFFENSDSKQQKLKKITLIFENDKSKKLRKRALKKFNEIKQEFISKKRVVAPTYFTSKNNQNGTFIDSIENVPFFTKKTQLNLALTLSFGIKDAQSSMMYHATNFTNYPYNKNLHPIIAIGKSLAEVEFTLKKNLIIEHKYYKHFNEATPKTHVVKDFIEPETLKDYTINSLSNNYRGFSNEFKMLKDTLNTNQSEFFKTPQFYDISKKPSKENKTTSFLDEFKKEQMKNHLLKEAIYIKELKVLSDFHTKNSVDFTTLNKEKLRQYLILNIHFKSNFFSQKQMKLHLKMSEIISYKNEESNEFHMKESIKKYL